MTTTPEQAAFAARQARIAELDAELRKKSIRLRWCRGSRAQLAECFEAEVAGNPAQQRRMELAIRRKGRELVVDAELLGVARDWALHDMRFRANALGLSPLALLLLNVAFQILWAWWTNRREDEA